MSDLQRRLKKANEEDGELLLATRKRKILEAESPY